VWTHIWHLQVSAGEKVVRSILIYAFVIIALRVFGKRELGQTNTLDLVVLLLMANAVQNGIIGNDVSVTGAVIGATVLFTLNNFLARAQYRFPILSFLFEGKPTELISDGRPNVGALRHEQISLPELRAIARRQGFLDLGKVQTAILETNGVVTMWATGEPRRYHPAMPGGLRAGKRRRSPGPSA